MPGRVVRFRTGERRWAVPLTLVREVLESPALTRIPRARPLVAGVLMRGGVVVPVYDLEWGASPSHVLILEWAESRNGLRVWDPDAHPGVAELEGGDLGPPCRGLVRFQDGSTAERLEPAALYRLLGIPA